MRRALAVFILLSLAFQADAETTVWVADKAHSEVKFSVSHMVIAEVTGRFKEFDVTVQQKGDSFTDSYVEAVIKTNSIDTEVENRDKHLRSDDFLNAEKFPTMVFKSTSIEKTGRNTYKINGDLTIRDVTKPVVLDALFRGEIKDGRGNIKRGFKATTIINRFDFGANWNKTLETGGLIAGEDVEITLLMEFNQKK
jgi:polyisoprenoid-binding protein YceI